MYTLLCMLLKNVCMGVLVCRLCEGMDTGFQSRDIPLLAGICIDMCKGLQFLHGLGIAHGDLKAQNAGVDMAMTGKVGSV